MSLHRICLLVAALLFTPHATQTMFNISKWYKTSRITHTTRPITPRPAIQRTWGVWLRSFVTKPNTPPTQEPTAQTASWYDYFKKPWSKNAPNAEKTEDLASIQFKGQPYTSTEPSAQGTTNQQTQKEPAQPKHDKKHQEELAPIWSLEHNLLAPYEYKYSDDILKVINTAKNTINNTKENKTFLYVLLSDFFSLPNKPIRRKFVEFNGRYYRAKDLLSYAKLIIKNGGKLSVDPIENKNLLITLLKQMKIIEYYFSAVLIDIQDIKKPITEALSPFYALFREYALANNMLFDELQIQADHAAAEEWNTYLLPSLITEFKKLYNEQLAKSFGKEGSVKEIPFFASVINIEIEGKTALDWLLEALFVAEDITKMSALNKKTYLTYAQEVQRLFSSEYRFHITSRLKNIDALLAVGATLGKDHVKTLTKLLIDMHMIMEALKNTDLEETKFVIIDEKDLKIKIPLEEALLGAEKRLRIIANIYSLDYDTMNKLVQEKVQRLWHDLFGKQRQQVRDAKKLFNIPINQKLPQPETLAGMYRTLAKQNMKEEPRYYAALKALVEIGLDNNIYLIRFQREHEFKKEDKEESKQYDYQSESRSYRGSPEETLYATFGLKSDATFAEIKAARNKLLKQYHPDRIRNSFAPRIKKAYDEGNAQEAKKLEQELATALIDGDKKTKKINVDFGMLEKTHEDL